MRFKIIQMKQAKRQLVEQCGQSLVEVAMFMPILLILIVGVVEVSQLVITQNRISTAARNGARFGAQGGEDIGVRNIIMNTVTQTLDLNNGVWDIFVVRGELDSRGKLPESSFSYQHIYGSGMTGAYTTTIASSAWSELRLEIADRLSYPGTDPAGLKVVGVLILHEVESILGLDILPALVGSNTVRSFSMMRNSALATTVSQTSGCNGVYPLGVEEGIRSITQADFAGLTINYPSGVAYNDFPAHQPDRALLGEGREGYIYKMNILEPGALASQRIAWLQWNDENSGPGNSPNELLLRSLGYPGNSSDMTYGFIEPLDSTDRQMQVNDEVWRSTVSGGQFNSVRSALRNHIDAGRAVRLVLWDVDNEVATSGRVKMTGFAIFRMVAYGSDASGNFILLELIRVDDTCGQN